MLVLLVEIFFVKVVSPESSPIFKQDHVRYKLRSMNNERDAEDEVGLKKWGKVLCKVDMHELFQIWNILLGEMSFISSRPIMPKEMLVMTEAELIERQPMRPDITGWEAIHERESENHRQMTEKNSVNFLNSRDDARFQKPEFFQDASHLNDAGAKVYAKEIVCKLKDNLYRLYIGE